MRKLSDQKQAQTQRPVRNELPMGTQTVVQLRAEMYRREDVGGMGSRGSIVEEPNSCAEKFVIVLAWIFVVVLFPFSMICALAKVRQFERVVILRNGRLRQMKTFGPGLVFKLPMVDELKYCDLRTICYAVPPQEALTKDSLSVSVDAIIFYKIHDPVKAVLRAADFNAATQLLAATTLRNSIGTRLLTELLAERPVISKEVFEQMRQTTSKWGISCVRVDIKDISMPLQLQKAMAAEAESSRLVNAKIIVANAEIEATKSLQIATSMLSESPYSMQLRYLQSLHNISGDKTHTFVLPISAGLYHKVFK